jgi:two-component system OmpR family sensor kinase
VIELFLAFIFYHYYRIEEEHIRENLFLEMKNYSLFFDNERFNIDIVPKKKESRFYELYIDDNSLYILVPFPESPNDLLKVYYPKNRYTSLLNQTKQTILWQFFFLSLVAILISLLFSLYVLRPLRQSLSLLEVFIKDIIHDLNTPLTSILINLKMMDAKNEEVDSITQSAKAITMLHHNLDAYLKEQTFDHARFDIKEVIHEQIAFFKPMYDYLSWDIQLHTLIIKSDRHAFARIIYNLISNACKYNTPQGFIRISLHSTTLSITNSSYGIKEPTRIFDRFYKESERGLGIGLHIVEKLCQQLEIEKKLIVEDTTVTLLLSLNKVTLN